MKTIKIDRLGFVSSFPMLDDISEKLDRLNEKHAIDEINWGDFKYRPDVKFAIGYTDNEILLKYYITEDYFKAEKTETNQMVCEDSCVEFFVSPDDDGIYYNMEFNGIGTCLLGSGTGRADNAKADPVITSNIRRQAFPGRETVSERQGGFSWTITIAIATTVFFRHKVKELKGRTFRANFYKCGDKLSFPHYLTWNPVLTSKPDFHQPAFFGILKFQ
jgi:hypothetical protein